MISCLELDDARLDDGSVIMVGKETLEAKRGQTLFPSVKAYQRRVVKNRIHEIEQDGYCHSGRKLPNARFIENHPGLTGPGVRDGFSTQFGKSGLYAQTLENSVKLDCKLPQSGAAFACWAYNPYDGEASEQQCSQKEKRQPRERAVSHSFGSRRTRNFTRQWRYAPPCSSRREAPVFAPKSERLMHLVNQHAHSLETDGVHR